MRNSFYSSYSFDIEFGLPIEWGEEVYEGVWESLKKGRESEQQVTSNSLANSKTDMANQAQQYAPTNSDISTLEANSTPGSLSPAAQAQLAADQGKIQQTYDNAGQSGLQRIAQHGMGTLTGEQSSLSNTLQRGQAMDENAANQQAQINTHADQLAAINARTQLQSLYNPNGSLGVGAQSAMDQANMGSTLGDIGKGIGAAASIGSSIVGMGGLNNLGSSLMNGKTTSGGA